MLRDWEEIPEWMRIPEVREYYDILAGKKVSLFIKRAFDLAAAVCLLVILSPVMAVIAVLIVIDSPGSVFFRQERVTSYGKRFRIHKFRTMVMDADKIGTQITVKEDARITKVGKFLRKYHLDEIPQLLDIIAGDMSFVGMRPEVPKYVERYTPEMMATLLLPAGVTSAACVWYQNDIEQKSLQGGSNVDDAYVEQVLPTKMQYYLDELKNFSVWMDLKLMLLTVTTVFFHHEEENTKEGSYVG